MILFTDSKLSKWWSILKVSNIYSLLIAFSRVCRWLSNVRRLYSMFSFCFWSIFICRKRNRESLALRLTATLRSRSNYDSWANLCLWCLSRFSISSTLRGIHTAHIKDANITLNFEITYRSPIKVDIDRLTFSILETITYSPNYLVLEIELKQELGSWFITYLNLLAI